MNQNLNSPLLQKMRQAIEEHLKLSLEELRADQNPNMANMIAYHLGWDERDNQAAGKRIRPLLALLSCASVGGDWTTTLPMGTAIELIHNFSLVHDDIEDNSETRRGRPTIWKRWGISKAINLGDAIFVLSRLSSYQLQNTGISPERILEVLHVLDLACLELTIGQQMDLEFEELASVDLDTYLRMIRGKTSALVAASTKCGAILGGAQESIVDTLSEYGYHLGLAFQIQDDILGIWGKTALTGKSTEDDLRSRKKTLPILYGLNRSQEFKKLWDTEKVDEGTLIKMRQALESSNALYYTREKAESHTQSALNALASFAGKDPFQQELITLTHDLLHREQ